MQQDEVATAIPALLDEIQASLFEKALSFREENSQTADTWEEFESIDERKSRIRLRTLGRND